MKTKRLTPIFAFALLLPLTLGACQTAQDNPKQTVGTLLGAGVGALVGSQLGGGKGKLAAVAVGAIAGGLLGSELGKSLDRADKAYAERTTQNSLEYNRAGQVSSWKNPDSGNGGTITPVSTYKAADGADCREYTQTIEVGGRSEQAVGKACRQPDGTWRIVG